MSSHSLDGIIDFAIGKIVVLMPKSDERAFDSLETHGMAASGAKNYPDAQRYFTQALEINPGSDTCYYWRACAKGQQLDYAGALEDMNRAIELNAYDPDYLGCRAKILTALGRGSDAQADIELAKVLRGPAATAASLPASKPAM
jgi:tetratricopeptide (TPR) repeat protein